MNYDVLYSNNQNNSNLLNIKKNNRRQSAIIKVSYLDAVFYLIKRITKNTFY